MKGELISLQGKNRLIIGVQDVFIQVWTMAFCFSVNCVHAIWERADQTYRHTGAEGLRLLPWNNKHFSHGETRVPQTSQASHKDLFDPKLSHCCLLFTILLTPVSKHLGEMIISILKCILILKFHAISHFWKKISPYI